MQVNVLISDTVGNGAPALLVLPYTPLAAIPRHLQGMSWRHLAITASGDKLLGASADVIEAAVSECGYALVQPTG
jgi:hypothetical protein